MREYALSCAQMSGRIGVSPVGIIRQWFTRRRLAALDDTSLHARDLTREDIEWALKLPLATDAELAIDERKIHLARMMSR